MAVHQGGHAKEYIKSVQKLKRQLFTTISGHFIANYINIFHKTEVLTIILSCLKESES